MSANKMTIAERLRNEIDRVPGGITAVANTLGKARNTIYNWMERGNVPADDLLRLGDLGVDVQYVLTGKQWGPFGQIDSELATLTGADRAKAALDRVLTVQTRIGYIFTAEQLQSLIGYTYEHAPTIESLEAFVRAALLITGNEKKIDI